MSQYVKTVIECNHNHIAGARQVCTVVTRQFLARTG